MGGRQACGKWTRTCGSGHSRLSQVICIHVCTWTFQVITKRIDFNWACICIVCALAGLTTGKLVGPGDGEGVPCYFFVSKANY